MSEKFRPVTAPIPQNRLSFAAVAEYLVDLVFPPACGNCGRVDFKFCAECRRLLGGVPVNAECKQVANLSGVCATGLHAGILQVALQSFKYEGARELASALAGRLITVLNRLAWSIDMIVPVPLYADRLQERGYNQALLLSGHVARALSAPCRPSALRRIRETSPQARLSQGDRRLNVKGAFDAGESMEGQSVLLIDDVVTTGSTLSECAAALRAAEARCIYAIAVSHAQKMIHVARR